MVDEAARYAESKGVLLVQPLEMMQRILIQLIIFRAVFSLKKTASNWLVVGASAPGNDIEKASLTANFSNYGKKAVDVFAPGVKTYSTNPEMFIVF
jgi:subtilisin family serine protease